MPIPTVSFTDERLPNGLRLIIAEDHLAPVVAVNLWYNVGSKHEVEGKTGFAHLFEHVMFQGSRNVAKAEHIALVQAAGGTMNGTTWLDRTNYFETVPSHQLELALWLEADRMGTLLDALSQENLDNQREVVKNEKRWSYDNRPYGSWNEKLQAHLFPPEHPVPPHDDRLDGGPRRGVGRGRQRVLPDLLRAEQRGRVGRRRRRPGGRAAAGPSSYFGGIPANPSIPPLGDLSLPPILGEEQPRDGDRQGPAAARLRRLPRAGVRRHAARRARHRLAGPRRRQGQPAPPAPRPRRADRPGRRPVHARLRRRRSIAAGWATVRPGVEVSRVEAALHEELERIGREPVTDDELARARALIESDELGALEPGRGAGRPALDVRDAVRRPGPDQPDARRGTSR